MNSTHFARSLIKMFYSIQYFRKDPTAEDLNTLQKETFSDLDKLFNQLNIDLSNLNIPWTNKADTLQLVSHHNPDFDINQPYYRYF
jgi:arsenate reductase-like glutaredoxin family protein